MHERVRHTREAGLTGHSALARGLSDQALLKLLETLAKKFDADRVSVYDAKKDRNVPVNQQERSLFLACELEHKSRFGTAVQVKVERHIANLPTQRDTSADHRKSKRYSDDRKVEALHQPQASPAEILAETVSEIRRGRIMGWNQKDPWDTLAKN